MSLNHGWKFRVILIGFFGNQGFMPTMTQASGKLMADAWLKLAADNLKVNLN
jgi:hypothetical protein